MVMAVSMEAHDQGTDMPQLADDHPSTPAGETDNNEMRKQIIEDGSAVSNRDAAQCGAGSRAGAVRADSHPERQGKNASAFAPARDGPAGEGTGDRGIDIPGLP